MEPTRVGSDIFCELTKRVRNHLKTSGNRDMSILPSDVFVLPDSTVSHQETPRELN